MGIATIVASALKKVPWTTLAMNYGPEVLRRLKEQVLVREEAEPEAAPSVDRFVERIRELEGLLAEREDLLARQQERIGSLEQACATLQGRVRTYQVTAAVAAVAAVALLVVMLAR